MKEENVNIIKKFGEYSDWVTNLKNLKTAAWDTPISSGKWTVAEIISHITNWDNYLLDHIIPSVKKGQGMVFPDFNSYNNKASEYAKSGITPLELIDEAITARESLVNTLLQIPEKDLCKPLTSNGVSHCPNTGEPYSLLYVINEFTQHDHHHINQITQYLSEIA
ncbi:DinB family protein [Bacillus sp. APMAM]|nr:DinB family protein [Bacillus sp. APMAM]RTZ53612.1 DinB family protein [Bacillus sp. SAJ1]